MGELEVHVLSTSTVTSCSKCLVAFFIFQQLLTDEEFCKLRLKQVCAQLQPKRGQSRAAQLLALEEEQRCMYIHVDGNVLENQST